MKTKSIVIATLAILLIFGFLIIDPETITFDDASWEFTTEKPDINDPDVLMCVPAAYTAESGEVIGHYKHAKRREGKPDYRYRTVYLDKGYFQQLTLVIDKKTKKSNDTKKRFRRALCKKGNKYYIENSRLPVTLTAFAEQLCGKYDFACNLDMGTYSYGWYKESGRTHHIGIFSFLNSGKQSNWLVVRKRK